MLVHTEKVPTNTLFKDVHEKNMDDALVMAVHVSPSGGVSKLEHVLNIPDVLLGVPVSSAFLSP
jgi:hypothetical protein